MPKAIVLMTALIPTEGHAALIKFATRFVGEVHVIISGRTFEPVPLHRRSWAISKEFKDFPSVHIHEHMDSNAPQNPSPEFEWDIAFWAYWKNTVNNFVGEVSTGDCVIASELYGIDLAKALGCKFVPFDINRYLVQISGTEVREDIYSGWDYILPEMRHFLKKTVTIFGAESCGKTTMTKYLSDVLFSPMVDEWARPYLELPNVGPEVTEEKMEMIVNGQYALQGVAKDDISSYFTFQDTDLLSTLGYYRIWGHTPPEYLAGLARMYQSDLYIVMNDGIPFEQDILRYGETKRESKTQFWVDILEEFGCEYHVVKNTILHKQREEVVSVIWDFYDKNTSAIRNFVRE